MSLDVAFDALADPTRRSLLERLEGGEFTLSELASPLPLCLMGVQKHVQVLERAGLVSTYKVGRSRHVRLRPEGLKQALDWVQDAESRWNAAFDRLAEVLEDEKSK